MTALDEVLERLLTPSDLKDSPLHTFTEFCHLGAPWACENPVERPLAGNWNLDERCEKCWAAVISSINSIPDHHFHIGGATIVRADVPALVATMKKCLAASAH